MGATLLEVAMSFAGVTEYLVGTTGLDTCFGLFKFYPSKIPSSSEEAFKELNDSVQLQEVWSARLRIAGLALALFAWVSLKPVTFTLLAVVVVCLTLQPREFLDKVKKVWGDVFSKWGELFSDRWKIAKLAVALFAGSQIILATPTALMCSVVCLTLSVVSDEFRVMNQYAQKPSEASSTDAQATFVSVAKKKTRFSALVLYAFPASEKHIPKSWLAPR